MRTLRTLLALLTWTSVAIAQQPAKWRLVEEWRVGGEVDGAFSFGDVRGMGVLPNGGIVYVDYKDAKLHFLDAKGQLVRTVGRKGAGPGEYQQANGLAVSSNGTVVVNDASNNRFTLLAANGDLVRTIQILDRWGFGFIWDAYYLADGRLEEFVSVRKPGEKQSISARRIWSTDFAKNDTTFAPECPNVPKAVPGATNYSFQSARGGTVMGVPFLAPSGIKAFTRDGAEWLARYPDFATITRTPRGKCEAEATIRLSSQRVPIPTAVRDSQVDRVKQAAARYGEMSPNLGLIPNDYPPFERLLLDATGRPWVERRTTTGGRRFEVFSAAGRLIAELDSPTAFTAYRPVVITNDRVLSFITDADDLPFLVAYRIVR